MPEKPLSEIFIRGKRVRGGWIMMDEVEQTE